jgi:2-oxoglutarate dehydrogenase E2 component (dihydrolipoamide succinyltransferase)
MLIEVKVPGVGESIESGILVEWLEGEGELVKRDTPLFTLETDKVTLTVNSTHTGWLTKKAMAGDEVKIGQVIAVIDTSAEKGPPMVVSTDVRQEPGVLLEAPAGMPQLQEKMKAAPTSPVVRMMIEENSIDPQNLKGSGRGGRITKEDVWNSIKETAAEEAEEIVRTISVDSLQRQARKQVSPIRARIAERLLQSQNTTAQLTTFVEADLTNLFAARERSRRFFEETYGVPLTFLPFFVKAVVEGLKTVRALATFMAEDELVENNYYDIGIAISAEHGLVVPVLRNADQKPVPQIQIDISSLAQKVREKKITLDELQGGVFTITNAGSYGGLFGTPILNPPQSGVLGVYVIEDRPKVVQGIIEIRKLCYLALTYDHRIVDGKDAGVFLKTVSAFIEKQAARLLEV